MGESKCGFLERKKGGLDEAVMWTKGKREKKNKKESDAHKRSVLKEINNIFRRIVMSPEKI